MGQPNRRFRHPDVRQCIRYIRAGAPFLQRWTTHWKTKPMPPAVFNSSHLFHTGRDSRQSGSACTDSFNKGIVFVSQVEIGPVEYLIRGLNTMDEFQNLKLGAGLIRGRIVSSLFERKAGGTVLVDRFGEAVKFAVFGLQIDGVTATVHVQPHEQN